MKLTLYQHNWTAGDDESGAEVYGTAAEAVAGKVTTARELIEGFDADDFCDALESNPDITAERLDAIRATPGYDAPDLTDMEAIDAAVFMRRYTSSVDTITVDISAETLLTTIMGARGEATAAAYFETGVTLALEATGRIMLGDAAAAMEGLSKWADDVRAEFPALDFADPDAAPVCVVDIKAGDLVDLEGAPGCDGEAFVGCEFEYATCIGGERETSDVMRLDFEGLPSVGFDATLSLSVIKGVYPGVVEEA
jgi:hypothetical protein